MTRKITLISAALGLSLTLTSLASAEPTTCSAPTAPTVPATFADLAAAEATEAIVEAYLEAAVLYQKCLAEERASFGAAITEEKDTELAGLVAASRAETKAIAESYNEAVIALHAND